MDPDDAAGCPDSDWSSSSDSCLDEYDDQQELVDSYRRLSTLDTTDYETESEKEESDTSAGSNTVKQ